MFRGKKLWQILDILSHCLAHKHKLLHNQPPTPECYISHSQWPQVNALLRSKIHSSKFIPSAVDAMTLDKCVRPHKNCLVVVQNRYFTYKYQTPTVLHEEMGRNLLNILHRK